MWEWRAKVLNIVSRLWVAAAIILSCAVAAVGESPSPGVATKAGTGSGISTFEPDRFLISPNGEASNRADLVLSPEVGISHTARHREQPGGFDNITHKLHAQAGGRVSLYDRFYLGFATKLPIYNYEAARAESPSGASPQLLAPRHDYELLRLSPDNLTMTGEIGYRIGQRLHLNIYYDQNRYLNPTAAKGSQDEEVFGTRLIYRFK